MEKKEFTGNSAREIICKVLEDEKITQKELADRLGMLRQSVNQALTSSNMGFNMFAKMVDELGYEIVLREK